MHQWRTASVKPWYTDSPSIRSALQLHAWSVNGDYRVSVAITRVTLRVRDAVLLLALDEFEVLRPVRAGSTRVDHRGRDVRGSSGSRSSIQNSMMDVDAVTADAQIVISTLFTAPRCFQRPRCPENSFSGSTIARITQSVFA